MTTETFTLANLPEGGTVIVPEGTEFTVTCSPRLKAGAFSGCDIDRLPKMLPLADPS